MSRPPAETREMLRQAERCERLYAGVYDAALSNQLLKLADEFRAKAAKLQYPA